MTNHQQQQQYFEDDYTIETIANNTAADNVVVEVEDLVFIHSVFIKIKNRKHQERSSSCNVSSTTNLSPFETLLSEQYELKEESFFKSWFERKVINNPRNERITAITNNNELTNTNKLSIPKLCGLSSNLQIYFRKNEHEQLNSKSKTRHQKLVKLKPINKMATLLTFNPDTGLYGQLIRGNAYIVIIDNNSNKDDNNSDSEDIITVQILKDILELIYKYKNIYHQYGADFNRDGRIQLLQACSGYKNKYKKKKNNNNQQQQSDDERIIAVNNENKNNVQHHTRTDTGITDDSSSSHSHSHSSNNSSTNIDNIIGNPKQKRRSESSDEYVYSINILDEEISAVHSRNNSATTVDATKIKLLHPPLHPPLHIATPSTSTSNAIVDAFENMADEIIFSFQQEVSKTIITMNDNEFTNNYDQRSSAELPLPSTPTPITITAGGTDKNKNNSTNNSHSRKISSLSDTSTTPKTIQEEELIQDDEENSLLCDNNNNNNSNNNNTDVVETTTTQIKKSHRMNQSLPELLLREESLYPDSHLRSVYNSIHEEKEKEENKKSVLTHRSLQLHNNEIDIDEPQQKQEVVNKKNHHHIVKSILKATASTSPISTPKTKTNYLSVYNILQSPSLSLQLSEAAEAEVPTIKAPTTTTTTKTSIMAEDNDTFTLVSENTDNYINCPKYYSSPSPPPSPPSPPSPPPPQIPIPGIIVRRLTSI